ncbi:hypothetical protein ACIHDR_43270 [Nocardia sp. NPDC052278]|uniref:hypothetical protein n=1 Tax=unclassified Nocardia TaxID=2637762 RepID=UPI0036982128
MAEGAIRWCGYAWGGAYLDHHTHRETVAALTRAPAIDPAVVAVILPDHTHRPHGQQTIAACARRIRLLTTGTPSGRTEPATGEVGRDG